MKKIYVFVAALFIGAHVNAQTVVDFESVTLSSESYDNGSGGAGEFVLDGIRFANYYNSGGWWNGFSISNTTDVTTPGYGNQYSVITGSGNNGSSNYAIYYSGEGINGVSAAQAIDSFKITNTTYAALSMLDGDGIGKQFGSTTNAQGADDGTNGEDFFKVWFICEDYGQTMKDSVEFYLADYRFQDNNMDYIVQSWTNIDVSGFGFDVNIINFRFESSDMSNGFINTPTYFAMDDMNIRSNVGVEELSASSINCYPNPVSDVLTVEGGEGTLRVFDVNGRVMVSKDHNVKSQVDFAAYPSGVYTLELITSEGRLTQKILK